MRLNNDYSREKVPFWPIFAVATLNAVEGSLETLLDETIVGNMFNEEAFGAINLLEPYMGIQCCGSYLLCVGGLGLIVRALGNGDREKASYIFGHCLTSVLAWGIILFLLYTIFAKQMVWLVAGDSTAAPYSLQAIRGQAWYMLVNPFYTFIVSYVLYMQGPMLVLLSTVLYLPSNCGLSILFGSWFGLSGVTFAACIATLLQIAILLIFFIKKENRIRFKFHIDFSLIKRIFILCVAESSLLIALVIVESVFNTIALMNYGVMGVGVIAIMIDLYYLILYTAEGISEFETVSINAYIGQKRKDRLDGAIRTVLITAVAESVFFLVLILAAGPYLAGLMGIDDPKMLLMTEKCIKYLCLFPFIACLLRILTIFYQYTGRTLRALYGFIIGLGVFPSIAALIFGKISLIALTMSLTIGPLAALLLLVAYVKLIKKEKLFGFDMQA